MSPASRSFAIVIGVEETGVYPDDTLIGPCRDAMKWSDALMAWGIPKERMKLFVSARQPEMAELKLWNEKLGFKICKPTHEEIRDFLVDELPKHSHPDGGELIFVWSGHGVMYVRDARPSRRLFYCDATDRNAKNVDIQNLTTGLAALDYRGFEHQVFVVDACANFSTGFSRGRRIPPGDTFGNSSYSPISQMVLMAVSPGQIAQSTDGSNARETMGAFSRRLIDALQAQKSKPGLLPDFDKGFNDVRPASKRERESDPTGWYSGAPRGWMSGGLPVLGDEACTTLIRALVGVRDESLLKNAFIAVIREDGGLPERHFENTGYTDIGSQASNQPTREYMAEFLSQKDLGADDEGTHGTFRASALVRWAAQVEARLNDSFACPELTTWLKGRLPSSELSHLRSRTRVLVNLDQSEGRICFVLIWEEPADLVDVSSSTTGASLEGCLFVGMQGNWSRRLLTIGSDQQIHLKSDRSDRPAKLAELLERANQQAQQLGVDVPDMVVEVALPLKEIDENIEEWQLRSRSVTSRLGTRFTVLRRVKERLDALHRRALRPSATLDVATVQWTKDAPKYSQNLSNFGLRIEWVNASLIAEGLLEARTNANSRVSCVGLRRDAQSDRLDEQTKDVLYECALAFACWSVDAWDENLASGLEMDLAACKGSAVWPGLLGLRKKHGFRDHPSAGLRILWDDPDRNPYVKETKFQGS